MPIIDEGLVRPVIPQPIPPEETPDSPPEETPESPSDIPTQDWTESLGLNNLTESYGSECVPRPTKWNGAPTADVFSAFSLSTDGAVNGNSLLLTGDSSLSFIVKDKSYVKLKLTLKSRVLRNGESGYPYNDSFEVTLESGDSLSAGTESGSGEIGSSNYDNFSVIKNGSEKVSGTQLDFLNNTYVFNQIEITWIKAVRCFLPNPKPDIGLEQTPELDTDSSGYIEQPDDGFTEVDIYPNIEEIESSVGELSEETLWAILGAAVLFITATFLLKSGDEVEGCD